MMEHLHSRNGRVFTNGKQLQEQTRALIATSQNLIVQVHEMMGRLQAQLQQTREFLRNRKDRSAQS